MKKEERLVGRKNTYVKTRTIFQMEATECGAASLAMVLGYYGKEISLEEARVAVGVSRDGVKAGNIMRAASEFHMEVHGYRKELEKLLELKPPCIIHWNFNHFVVYEGIKNGKIYINDPAAGHRKITLQELDDAYTGIVITIEPGEGFEKQKREKNFLTLIHERLQGQWKPLGVLVFLGLMLVYPNYLVAGFSQVFVDVIMVNEERRLFGLFLFLVLANLLFRIFFSDLRNRILLNLQNKLALLSGQKFFHHLFRLPMTFFEQRYAGDLSSRISNNDSVSMFLAGELGDTAISLMESVFYLMILWIYSPKLVVIALIGLALDFVLIVYASGHMKEISMKMNQDIGKMTGALYAGLAIMESIKATGAENSFLGRLLGYYAKNCNTEQEMSRTQQLLNAFPQAIMQILNVLLLLFGSIQVMQGTMTAGALVAFTSLFTAFLEPVNKLLGFVYHIQMMRSDMERVRDIMAYPEEEKYQQENCFQGKLEGNVRLEHVSFGYSRLGEPNVQDVSFEVKKGKSIAIIGASGSGKSTMAKIICGLYQPWEGKVYLDDKPMDEISTSTMHSSVADVSQKISLFGGTVNDNLTLWNPEIPDEDVIAAAKDAGIHEVITELPNAYEAILMENGRNLSGGQRQRLEIARALVRNPSVLLLDEATSALDPITEKQVLENIKRRGCTCIVIAHRLSAIRDCDQILVMDKGRIVEQGNHESLMQNGSLYQKLIQLN